MRKVRQIVVIDEEKCNGCGLCVPACPEGALQIIDGKARLVSESYCDGLGACLGHCPQGAITIEEREVEEFDPAAVERHLAELGRDPAEHHHGPGPHQVGAPQAPPAAAPVAPPSATHHSHPAPACPGSAVETLPPRTPGQEEGTDWEAAASQLRNWPVQLALVPPNAPWLQAARLLIAADCVPFALASFHRQFLAGHVLLIGCPKLDDADFYYHKLTQLIAHNDLEAVEVVHMEVPCCFALRQIVTQAIRQAGKHLPVKVSVISRQGEVLETSEVAV
jgi:NAD-dependent dihydropyrimidine dehydrogenase PreA subunit